MANDVTIVVEASLGDTLIKLDLAKHAINDLGDESKKMAVEQDAAAASTGFFSASLGNLNQIMGTTLPFLSGVQLSIAALPAIAGVAAVAIIALADAVGTLVAIVADLVAPVTLVVGLMGLLAGGFLLAAKSAFGSGGALGGQVEVLKHQFDNLTKTLVQDFMPVFRFLIDNAHQALTYLNQIAKLPLAQAFKSLATTGVQAVTKFLQQVGSLLAKPFRLAIQIAFGSGKGGNEIASAVAGLWKQFTDFLFGYTKTHPVQIAPRTFVLKSTTVDGALQPFIDWFNRHNFTAQGIKIGHQLLNGLRPIAKPLGQFLVTVLEDGVKTAVKGMLNAINPFSEGTKQKVRALNDWISHALVAAAEAAWNMVKAKAEEAWQRIGAIGRSVIIGLVGAVAGPLVGAWGSVAGAIRTIVGLIQSAIGLVQSLVSAIQSAASAASALSLGNYTGRSAGRTGQGGRPAPHITPGGHVTVNHFHLNGGDRASFSRQVREIGRELGRQQHILAGGQ